MTLEGQEGPSSCQCPHCHDVVSSETGCRRGWGGDSQLTEFESEITGQSARRLRKPGTVWNHFSAFVLNGGSILSRRVLGKMAFSRPSCGQEAPSLPPVGGNDLDRGCGAGRGGQWRSHRRAGAQRWRHRTVGAGRPTPQSLSLIRHLRCVLVMNFRGCTPFLDRGSSCDKGMCVRE